VCPALAQFYCAGGRCEGASAGGWRRGMSAASKRSQTDISEDTPLRLSVAAALAYPADAEAWR
jgi:hypothetical protein